MESTKILIIGAGPAGIAAGVEAAISGIKEVILLEKAWHSCDTIASLYREGKRVDSVYKKIRLAPIGALSFGPQTKEQFLAWIIKVISDNGLDVRYGHDVYDIKAENHSFLVTCVNGASFKADIVIIAIGVFGKPVKPLYKIPKEIKNRIFYSLPLEPLSDMKVLVVGGGDSAAEAACYLSMHNKVTLSYRRSEFFRINEQNLCSLNQCCSFENLETRLGIDIVSIEPDAKGVKVSYSDGQTGTYDAIFYLFGGSTPRVFLEMAHVAYSEGKPETDKFGETNIKNLFLAGDLVADKGTIMAAFNSGAVVIKKILESSSDGPSSSNYT
jgi:thioredoxin reductase (NADPH)